jgi:hypothetical protein
MKTIESISCRGPQGRLRGMRNKEGGAAKSLSRLSGVTKIAKEKAGRREEGGGTGVRLYWFVYRGKKARKWGVICPRRLKVKERRPSLVGFIDDFNRPYFGVIGLWREREEQFALAVGAKAMKLANDGLECAGSGLGNIEVLEQSNAIAGDVENPAADSMTACGRDHGTEKGLEEMELDGVAAGGHGDGIAEVAKALSGVEVWKLRSPL